MSEGESLYAHAGGWDAVLGWARAFHARALADGELQHPFSHPGQHPRHVERLAAYWAQALGGPSIYTDLCGDQPTMVRMHLGRSGGQDTTGLEQRFVACAEAALDDAGLPRDVGFRTAVHDYLIWSLAEVLPAHDDPEQVPDPAPVPVWSWGGLQHVGRARG